MESYRLTTKIDRLEWKGEKWKDVGISWHVDPATRQFSIPQQDIRAWPSLSVVQKRQTLFGLWTYFQDEEVEEFSGFIAQYGWTVKATKLDRPYKIIFEDWWVHRWIEFDDELFPLAFAVTGTKCGGELVSPSVCPSNLGGVYSLEDELLEGIRNDDRVGNTSGVYPRIISELAELIRFIAASGRSRAEILTIMKPLVDSIHFAGAEEGLWY